MTETMIFVKSWYRFPLRRSSEGSLNFLSSLIFSVD
uniref:Uncharacterized protein n=1 Tax=Arundo donax TaxID=35708 RepID=A0A0A9HM21_ARUDO